MYYRTDALKPIRIFPSPSSLGIDDHDKRDFQKLWHSKDPKFKGTDIHDPLPSGLPKMRATGVLAGKPLTAFGRRWRYRQEILEHDLFPKSNTTIKIDR